MLKPNEDLKEKSLIYQEPKFKPGQLVRHKRYGYRGVVVDFDPYCKAEDDWYYSNQSQPDRFQPWYHVLVHQSTSNTYAAETNLTEDDSGEEILHPLLDYFFNGFVDGGYVRNDTAWPS